MELLLRGWSCTGTRAGFRLRAEGTHVAHGAPGSAGTSDTAWERVCWLRGECLIKGIAGKVLGMFSDYKQITASESTAWWWERGLNRLARIKEWIRASHGSTAWSEDCLESIYTCTSPRAKLLFHKIQHICSDTWKTPSPNKQEGKDGNEEDQVETVTEYSLLAV